MCVCGVGFGSGECATHIHVDKQSIDRQICITKTSNPADWNSKFR